MGARHRIAAIAWVVASVIASPRLTAAQPRRDSIVQLRQDLEVLRGQLALLHARGGQHDVDDAELAQRIAALEQRAAAVEAVARTDVTGQLTAVRAELSAQIEQLRAEVQQVLYAEVPTQVDHEGGFVWTTDDDKYQLRLGGHLQMRWTVERHGDDDRDAGFSLRRARPVIEGTGAGDLGFRIMGELANEPALLDGWLEYRAGDFALRAGKDQVPFLRSGVMPEHQYAFAERAVLADAYGWERDIGLQLRVRPRHAPIAAVLMVANGGPDSAADDIPMVALRAQFTPIGPRPDPGAGAIVRSKFSTTIGFGFVIDGVAAPAAIGSIPVLNDLDGDGEADRILTVTSGLDVTFRIGGLELAAEAMVRLESWGDLLAVNSELTRAVGLTPQDRGRWHGAVGFEATYTLGETIMIGTRLAGGTAPFLSMSGPSILPPGESVIETDAMAGYYDDGVRVFGVTYRRLDYGRGYGAGAVDGPVEHAVIAEAQVVL
jgi:hypothetical protein